MNIESIETFILLAENNSFTQTAEAQYIVQSTVSNRINELEKYVGKELFIRNNRSVSLTKAGEAFLPYAKNILMLKKDGVIKARSIDTYKDRLALGMTNSIYRGIMAHLIRQYFLQFKDIAVKLKVNHSEDIIKLLEDGILDIGFTYTKEISGKFRVIELLEDEIILVGSAKSKIINGNEVSSRDLMKLPLLYADLGEGFFKWLSKVFEYSPLLKISADEVSIITDYVKEDLGYAFVTKSSVRQELDRGELLKINIKDSKPPSRKIYMLINKNKAESIALENWIKVINEKYGMKIYI